jgi:hypothetical protein
MLPLDEEEVRGYTLLYQQVEQFRMKSYEELLAEIVEHVPPEVRVRGLAPDQIARVLTREQIAGLTPEQILGALPPEALEQLARKLLH